MAQVDIQQIEEGWDVYASDGEKLGDVSEIGPNYLLVTKGFLFPTDLYIPTSAITNVEYDRVYLNASSAEVKQGAWSQPPATSGETDAGYATSQPADTATIERREEELRTAKRATQAGEVEIRKDVVEEQATVDVPVTREQAEIRRRSVDRPAGGEAFGNEEVAVPIMEERVEVTKEPRVVEEIEVGKTAVQDTERVSETLRKERVSVDEEGDSRLNR